MSRTAAARRPPSSRTSRSRSAPSSARPCISRRRPHRVRGGPRPRRSEHGMVGRTRAGGWARFRVGCRHRRPARWAGRWPPQPRRERGEPDGVRPRRRPPERVRSSPFVRAGEAFRQTLPASRPSRCCPTATSSRRSCGSGGRPLTAPSRGRRSSTWCLIQPTRDDRASRRRSVTGSTSSMHWSQAACLVQPTRRSIMVGAGDESFAKVEPTLRKLGKAIFRTGSACWPGSRYEGPQQRADCRDGVRGSGRGHRGGRAYCSTPKTLIDVVNESTGRSFTSEVVFGENVIQTGNGFKRFAKDAGIAAGDGGDGRCGGTCSAAGCRAAERSAGRRRLRRRPPRPRPGGVTNVMRAIPRGRHSQPLSR